MIEHLNRFTPDSLENYLTTYWVQIVLISATAILVLYLLMVSVRAVRLSQLEKLARLKEQALIDLNTENNQLGQMEEHWKKAHDDLKVLDEADRRKWVHQMRSTV
jgi:hypothetical protein